MTATSASAPGKIVLSGEYAVLDGAPAICMAIDRRARAEVSPATGPFLTVHATGCVNGEWRLPVEEKAEFEWPGDVPELLPEVWKTTATEAVFDVSLDTGEFLDPGSGLKLGLGSSAALTAALVSALLDATKKPHDVLTSACEAHRGLQQGYGSGVDVVTCLLGGVIEYRLSRSVRGRPISWPAGLEFGVLWCGRPASTSERLKKFEDVRRSDAFASVRRLREMSEKIAQAWPAGDTARLLETFRRYVDVLMQFDIDHDLGIFDAGHREMADAASDRKLIYKPCGAGGGDTGIVFATEKEAIEEFIHFAGERGFRFLDISLEARGVLVGSGDH